MTSSIELFKKYKSYSDILVETGTYKGDGIRCAISAGYKKMYSCDINKDYINLAKKNYSDYNLVAENLASPKFLEKILKEIDTRAVFFLDAHFWPENPSDSNSGFKPDTMNSELKPCPLIEELTMIKNHHIKNHVILIDDHQCFGTWMFENLTLDTVDNFIMDINPSYKKSLFSNVVCYEAD